jgi:hypothetical protein
MNDSEKRTLDMFKRVRDFDAAREGLFDAGTLARELFTIIGSVINDLEGHAATESEVRGAARQGTASKAAARAAIDRDLGTLRRTARTMSSVMPGFEEKFRVPPRQDGQELIYNARAALAAAEPFKAEFRRREVPERVFQDLEANIKAYEAALTDQHTAKEERVTAAALIDAAIKRGMDAVHQLDAIVRNKLRDNAAALAAWLSARRIERPNRRNRNNNHNTPPAPQTPKT